MHNIDSYSDTRSRQHANFLVMSARLKIHFTHGDPYERWVYDPPDLGLISKQPELLPKHSRCVVSYFYSAALSVLDQYLSRISVPYGCSCLKAQPIRSLQSSVPSLKCCLLRGNAINRAYRSLSCTVPNAAYISFLGMSTSLVPSFWAFCWALKLCRPNTEQTAGICWIIGGKTWIKLWCTVVLSRKSGWNCDHPAPILLAV